MDEADIIFENGKTDPTISMKTNKNLSNKRDKQERTLKENRQVSWLQNSATMNTKTIKGNRERRSKETTLYTIMVILNKSTLSP
jgi:precorrin-2 methylase